MFGCCANPGAASSLVLWILIIALSILGGAAVIGRTAVNRKKLVSGAGQPQRSLGQPTERTLIELRVGDILAMDGQDYLCEGAIRYDEDGQRWISARCVDDQVIKWVVVGLDRAAASSVRVLAEEHDARLAGYPPESIAMSGVTYALEKRGTATCSLTGDVGGLAPLVQGRPAGHSERCRWWLYTGPGDATLLVEQWGADFRALRGNKVGESSIEFMPAS